MMVLFSEKTLPSQFSKLILPLWGNIISAWNSTVKWRLFPMSENGSAKKLSRLMEGNRDKDVEEIH